MPKFHFVLLIHAHQPVGNFDGVFERTYRQSYLPFIECLARHPGVHIGLHYSGPLLEWLSTAHPEYLTQLADLVARGQIELVGGGFYEPILISIPFADQVEQIQRLAAFLERQFGKRPGGAWLAERVWEPQLPSALAAAGVEYTLVDDSHFLSAGFEPEQMFGSHVAEDGGHNVKLVPGLQALRYLVPFRDVVDVVGFLRDASGRHPEGMAAMGDDLEKFGSWPGTYDHCYTNGWLDRFFSAIEAESAWLSVTPPGEYLATHLPLGRADLPAASYTEMMEWAFPTAARMRFHEVRRRFAHEPEVLRFLSGNFWRGFFSKYAESNLLNKKILRASCEIERLSRRRRSGSAPQKLAEARTHVLRAQCNDAYWHGVFGGVYAPHLRTALWREAIRAETLAESVGRRGRRQIRAASADVDSDGADEIIVTSSRFSALIKPSDGATLAALDDRRAASTLINSMMRRPEAYHDRLRALASGGPAPEIASIHDRTRAKEEGLERRLRYDRWPRHAFRLLLFAPHKTLEDYDALRLEEHADFAGGAYRVEEVTNGRVIVSAEATIGSGTLHVRKRFEFAPANAGFEVRCALEMLLVGASSAEFEAGLELVLNFLAPDEPDRVFETADGSHRLAWSGIASGPKLRVVDGWQNVSVAIEAREARHFWIVPIETVSESEDGFERVYQGSQIMPVWTAHLLPGTPWKAEVVLRIGPA
ncbi:MAG: alpha-amylase/4-alpha-glucanotransferase domain-containing protein [Candidatus Acidiferrales bacterium]